MQLAGLQGDSLWLLEWCSNPGRGQVLPDLLSSGVFCNSFDYVSGESHCQWGFYPMTLRDNVTLLNGRESINTAIRINPHCKTRFHEHDDESYLHGGMPLLADKTKAFGQVNATMADRPLRR